jgi:tripartite-type tricarboxylate transporter receptor subunit TctC
MVSIPRLSARTLMLSLMLTASAAALAQNYPNKVVRFIVPFAPGGQSDAVARIVGQELSKKWGQPVVVENKPGAATTIGSDLVAKAPADGYTILLAPAPFVITQYAYPKLPYDSRKDFVPVSLLVTNPLVITVNPQRMPIKTVREFVDAVKKEPGKVSYGTPGNGSLPHLAVALFQLQAGIDPLHVPYKGGGPAVIDLVGGQTSFMFASPLEVMPNVKAGRLNVIAVTSSKRVSYWPDVPTVVESGYPEYEAYAWFGVVAPAGTPRDVVSKINADIVAVLKTKEVADNLAAQGADVAITTPEEFGKFLDAEHKRWSAAVKAANIKIE